MNELEARRELLADPRRPSPALQAQVDADATLSALRDDLVRTDDAMHELLTREPVPEGLADRIVLRARYHDRSRWGFALAAALVVLAFAVPLHFGTHEAEQFATSGPALESAMIDHVAQGADELQDNPGIQPAVLRLALSQVGLQARESGYRIRHLANCVVAGVEGRHFTLDGPNGVVSFLVLPGTSAGESMLMREGDTRGYFMKRAGLTIGVFTHQDIKPAELEKMMHQVFA